MATEHPPHSCTCNVYASDGSGRTSGFWSVSMATVETSPFGGYIVTDGDPVWSITYGPTTGTSTPTRKRWVGRWYRHPTLGRWCRAHTEGYFLGPRYR